MTDVRYDEATGILHFSGDGFWSVDGVTQIGVTIQEALQRARRDFGSAAMLVITDAAQVQLPEVMAAAGRRMAALAPDDRVAVVMSSALVKMQAKRLLSTDIIQIFGSENEAVAWLMANRAEKGLVAANPPA